MNRADEKRLETLSPFEVKNELISMAKKTQDISMINAGRGNPNWVATLPRHAFFKLGFFALAESERLFIEQDGFGGLGQIENIESRFNDFVKADNTPGSQFLADALNYVNIELKLNKADLLLEWVDGILGDSYPEPDRMLKGAEKIVHQYLMQEMGANNAGLTGEFDIFAVEGGTAAMVYIFNTLKTNGFLKADDTIALAAPIFTPYIEMPELEDYDLKKIEIHADENIAWQIPDSEIERLNDPKVKAFFLVNPSNPASVKLSDDTLQKIATIANNRPDLILLTDDVYGTFTDNFTSLAMIAPKNTILVYSFSKYFGSTGWRLGVIATHKDNNFDISIANVNDSEKARLNKRYSAITLDVSKFKFIDRLVADSRAVALNHTAGLSTPQQVQMSLFSLMSLLDTENNYKNMAKKIIRDRYNALLSEVDYAPLVAENDENGAFYYVEVDIKRAALHYHNEAFFDWLNSNFEPLDFLIRLAEQCAVVVMPGSGFDDAPWSLRISLANLDEEDYVQIAKQCKFILEQYFQEFSKH